MRKNLKISICGDICSECPRYIATKNNNISDLEKLAELWYRLGFRDKILPPEELKCLGCSKDKFCSHNLNSCDKLDTIRNCGECDNFPCNKISLVFQKTDNTKELCKAKCSFIEYKKLYKAFFMKKQILTEINKNYKMSK